MTPYKEELKNKRIGIKLTETEFARLELEAGKRGLSMSELMRKLINNVYHQSHENTIQVR